MIEYKTVIGDTQFKPELGVDVEGSDFEDNVGWCLACGETQDGVEPDARRYACDCCGAHKVYGLGQLALMNLIA